MKHASSLRSLAIAIAATSLASLPATAWAANFEFDALTVLPRGELNENLDPAYGLGVQVLWPLQNSPVLLGVEGSVARYGEKRRTLFDDIDVVTSNDIAAIHAVLRLQATSGRVRPYFDVLVGVKNFQTQSTLVDDSCFLCDDDVAPEPHTELEDDAFSYGFGAGLRFALGESKAFLETKVRYTRGQDATYLTRGSIDDANLADRLRESSTDAWSIHIGISFGLL